MREEGARELLPRARVLEVGARRRQPNRPARREEVLRIQVVRGQLDRVRRPADVDAHNLLDLVRKRREQLGEEHREVAEAAAEVEDHEFFRWVGQLQRLDRAEDSDEDGRRLRQLLDQPLAAADPRPQFAVAAETLAPGAARDLHAPLEDLRVRRPRRALGDLLAEPLELLGEGAAHAVWQEDAVPDGAHEREAARVCAPGGRVIITNHFVRKRGVLAFLERITAPFAGRVGITEIDVGDRIDTNTLVTTIDDRSLLLVNFSVPEVYVDRVTRGTPVNVRLWDAADAPVSGEIVAVDSRIDINSRAFIARAAIDNSADRFRPGMAFEISINASRGAFLSVPDVAVQWGADGAYVWVAEQGRAARREVRLVKRLAGAILIEGELAEGEPVVMEGVQSVRAGVALKPLSDNLNPTGNG